MGRLNTRLDMSRVHHAPILSFGTASQPFAFSLPGHRCTGRSAVAVANLRGLSIRAAVAAAYPRSCLPVLAVLLSAAVEGAVAGILSKLIVAVNEAAQVLTLNRFFRSGGVEHQNGEFCERGVSFLVKLLSRSIECGSPPTYKGGERRHLWVGGANRANFVPFSLESSPLFRACEGGIGEA